MATQTNPPPQDDDQQQLCIEGKEGEILPEKGRIEKQQSKNTFKLPNLEKHDEQAIVQLIPEAREEIDRLIHYYNLLKTNYPQEFQNVEKNHPHLAKNIELAGKAIGFLGASNKSIDDNQLIDAVTHYNTVAQAINGTLSQLEEQEEEFEEDEFIQSALGKLPADEKKFTEEQKREIQRFAQDLMAELFPDSYSDKLVKWATDQKKLDGYQKILLAPANGIEGAVTGFIDLFNIKTYQELGSTLKTTFGMSYEDWCKMWKTIKFTYENLPMTDQIAPILSLLVAVTTLVGGSSRMIGLAKKLGYSSKLVTLAIETPFILRTATHVANPVGKATPISVMMGIVLPHLEFDRTNPSKTVVKPKLPKNNIPKTKP